MWINKVPRQLLRTVGWDPEVMVKGIHNYMFFDVQNYKKLTCRLVKLSFDVEKILINLQLALLVPQKI